MITRYDAAYLALSPLGLPYLAWRYARRGKYHQSAPAMLGRGLPVGEAAIPFVGGSVWIHAVSVGEVAAARAVEPHLRRLFPDLPFVLTTITETGQAAARRDLPEIEGHSFFPVDFSWVVRRFLDVYRPRCVILLETELWPNFLTLARERGARIFLLNGKLSDRSFPRYRRGRGVLAPAFDSIEGFCVQTSIDAERFAALGAAPERIRVTGNCKLDIRVEPVGSNERIALRADLGLSSDRKVIVAGSTHKGEEELILDAFRRVQAEVPDASLILAPRHPERFDAAAELIRARGFRMSRASEQDPEKDAHVDNPEVVLLDRMGVLARTYGLGEVAIVAGSFGRVGGHNLLEAAAHRVPVVYGPNMKSQREIARLFEAAGAGVQTAEETLAPELIRLLTDAEARRREGEKAWEVLRSNQGSAERIYQALREWLGGDAPREPDEAASPPRPEFPARELSGKE